MLRTMKKSQASLVDLHYDILKEILIRVVRSPNGAKDFAKAITVCKAFRKFVDDEDVLRAVAFEDLSIDGRWELFRQTGGLICRCAQAGGQEQAKFILAKIILVSASQLLKAKKDATDREASSQAKDSNLPKEAAEASDFLQNFVPDQTFPNFIGYHFDFVNLFLARVDLPEFMRMNPYVNDYMSYFIEMNTRFDQRARQTFKKFAADKVKNYHIFLHKETLLNLRAIGVFKQSIVARLVALEHLLQLGMNKELGEMCARDDNPPGAGHFAATNMIMERLDKELGHLRSLKATMERLNEKEDVSSLPINVPEIATIASEMEQIQAEVSMLLGCKEKLRSVLEELLQIFANAGFSGGTKLVHVRSL